MDAARAVAIAMMVVYHLTYDLEYFGGYDIESTSGFWARFADATAGTFLFLVGVSLAISYSRASAGGPHRSLFGKYLLRGIRILAYGMALTAVFLVFGMGVVAFGILHLIGVSIILAYPLLRYRYANLFLGLSIIAVGVYMRIEGFSSESPWLLPFGVVPENLVMPDYRPLLPWFGVVLLGLFAGNVVYGDGKRPALFAGKAPAAAKPLLPLGRNSLFIYLIHQPILILLLAAFGVIEVGFL
ncbi:MAG TPA: heparan-alpha-glucosaminide N-acetyltransferase [Rubrobacteraceae bacterium]|nr:heparan-alpha-glucosaminide N-acetyltransferase [Rubrobacteraceae bacterium]